MLGSGLGAFADELTEATRIPYEKIPGFPRSTAIGHAGRLVIGKVENIAVAAMQGRVHFYEGYTAQQVAFPMRVLGRLGIRSAILTNAAGGINLQYQQGALVVISDHINLQGINPLIGPNDERFGPRFPDMTQAYWKPYREIALAEAKKLGIAVTEGVYAALTGPKLRNARGNSLSCARLEPIWWACPRFRKRSPRATWEFAFSEFPASPIWPQEFSIRCSITRK